MDKKYTKSRKEWISQARKARNSFLSTSTSSFSFLVAKLNSLEVGVEDLCEKLNAERKYQETLFVVLWKLRKTLKCGKVMPYLYREVKTCRRKKISCGGLAALSSNFVEMNEEEEIIEGGEFTASEKEILMKMSAMANQYLDLQRLLTTVAGHELVHYQPVILQATMPVLMKARAERDGWIEAVRSFSESSPSILAALDGELDEYIYGFNQIRSGEGRKKYKAFRMVWEKPKGSSPWPAVVKLLQVKSVKASTGEAFFADLEDISGLKGKVLTLKALKEAFYRGKAKSAMSLYMSVKNQMGAYTAYIDVIENLKKVERFYEQD